MYEPHEGTVSLSHGFASAYNLLRSKGELTLATAAGTPFTARAQATTRRGPLCETGDDGGAGVRTDQGHARAGSLLSAWRDGVRQRMVRDLRDAQPAETVPQRQSRVELNGRKGELRPGRDRIHGKLA